MMFVSSKGAYGMELKAELALPCPPPPPRHNRTPFLIKKNKWQKPVIQT